MKMITKWVCCIAVVLFISTFETQAASAERRLTIALSGYYQDENPLGDAVAVPFRITNADVLDEISIATRTNVTGGVLLVVNSLDIEDSPSRIVVRTPSFELDVTEFFQLDQGSDVRATKSVGNVLKSATIYAIDQFSFSTIDDNGFELQLQGFTKETQKWGLKKIGAEQFTVGASSIASAGTGQIRWPDESIAPIKGTFKVSAPKFVP